MASTPSVNNLSNVYTDEWHVFCQFWSYDKEEFVVRKFRLLFQGVTVKMSYVYPFFCASVISWHTSSQQSELTAILNVKLFPHTIRAFFTSFCTS